MLIKLAFDIVAAYVATNPGEREQLSDLVRNVYGTLVTVSAQTGPASLSIADESIFRDRLRCLDCGRTFKALKRHLQADHNLSPADYRAKWDLPDAYPLVAPNYAAQRSRIAVATGLGLKDRQSAGVGRSS